MILGADPSRKIGKGCAVSLPIYDQNLRFSLPYDLTKKIDTQYV